VGAAEVLKIPTVPLAVPGAVRDTPVLDQPLVVRWAKATTAVFNTILLPLAAAAELVL
jgi:hypothetical protein